MDVDRFDRLARSLDARLSAHTGRRVLIQGSARLAPIVAGWSAFPVRIAARKSRKHKKKPGKNGASLCAKACGAGCEYCYRRPSGTLLCGGAGSISCELPCSTDDDCAAFPGNTRTVCTKTFTKRATGKASSWGCPGEPPGLCTSFVLCLL